MGRLNTATIDLASFEHWSASLEQSQDIIDRPRGQLQCSCKIGQAVLVLRSAPVSSSPSIVPGCHN